jgi:hypothetical protein
MEQNQLSKHVKLTAPEFVNRVKDMLLKAPDHMDFNQLSTLVWQMMELVEQYDREQEAERVAIDGAVSEMVAKDKEVNEIGLKYGLTLNQVAGFKELCEQLNENFRDSGVVVVPFWFLNQYQEMLAKIDALNTETQNLISTLSQVRSRGGSTIQMEERTSIITGHTMPYIPGETGPRIGDEHLDPAFNYHQAKQRRN